MTMPVNKWLMNKFKDINKERLSRHIDVISQRTGKSKLYIKCSMLWNFLTQGTSYTDYFRGNFIDLTREEKKTFATAKKFYELIDYLNDEEYDIVLGDKLIFNEVFREYLKRDFINLRKSSVDDLRKFLSDKTIVFAKETKGECGHGIIKVDVSNIDDVEKFYNECKDKGQLLIEDAIVQSEELDAINPYVVNSFRIVTLYKDGIAKVISNALRVNQGDSDVIGCTDDLYFSLGTDGRIDSNVIDDYGNIYDTHPMTGVRFKDVHISGVKEAFDMVEEAHLRIPQVRYIGWDIAFTVNGPVIVESNEYPGYGILQHYALKNKRTGHLKEIADFLGEEYRHIKL